MTSTKLIHWQTDANANFPDLSATMRDWLLYPGSFIQRLKAHGVAAPRVKVLQQSWLRPDPSECKKLRLNSRVVAWVREVLIYSGDMNFMYARTVIPHQTLTGSLTQLLHLKTRSLGSVLFKDPLLKRSEFELVCLQKGSTSFEKIAQIEQLSTVWGRRSLFYSKGKEVLLTEYFLPAVELCK